MKVGSLFSGIGGLELGLERAGMTTIWQSEMDPYASKVLAKNFPGVPNLGDITQIDWSQVERPDLVCGGFPCQPASEAGKRLGMADARWLWPEFARCLRELKPRWVLAENVPGLLSVDSGRGFGSVLRDLAQLGFNAEWGRIPAAAVGAPHLRWRVFLVAHAGRSSAGTSSGPDGQDSTQRSAQAVHAPGCGEVVADAGYQGLPESERQALLRKGRGDEGGTASQCGGWAIEPDVGRVAHGVPSRVDRLKCLGNAVVPQVAEVVGRWIMAQEQVPA
jgi:DNA (cytosine-5)-methyltransferase 1